MHVGRRGTVTYHRKLNRIGVRWDDDDTPAQPMPIVLGLALEGQIRVRHLRKLTELELLAEAT
jgi:hypothetical protein